MKIKATLTFITTACVNMIVRICRSPFELAIFGMMNEDVEYNEKELREALIEKFGFKPDKYLYKAKNNNPAFHEPYDEEDIKNIFKRIKELQKNDQKEREPLGPGQKSQRRAELILHRTELIKKVKRFRRYVHSSPYPPCKKPKGMDDSTWGRKYLWRQVDEWILDKAEGSVIFVNDGKIADFTEELMNFNTKIGEQGEYQLLAESYRGVVFCQPLVWRDPKDRSFKKAFVSRGSDLDRLRKLAIEISEEIGCRLHRGTRYVLTDDLPIVPAIKWSIHPYPKFLESFSITYNSPQLQKSFVGDVFTLCKEKMLGN